MKKLFKLVLKLATCAFVLFCASIVVYFFNLDMRFIAKIQPLLEPIYDRVERRPMP